MTISDYIALISATVSEIIALTEDARKKLKKKSKAETRLATLNFRPRAVNKVNQTELKGNGKTRKIHTKP